MHVIQKSHHSYHDKASHSASSWLVLCSGWGDFNLKRVILTDILHLLLLLVLLREGDAWQNTINMSLCQCDGSSVGRLS